MTTCASVILTLFIYPKHGRPRSGPTPDALGAPGARRESCGRRPARPPPRIRNFKKKKKKKKQKSGIGGRVGSVGLPRGARAGGWPIDRWSFARLARPARRARSPSPERKRGVRSFVRSKRETRKRRLPRWLEPVAGAPLRCAAQFSFSVSASVRVRACDSTGRRPGGGRASALPFRSFFFSRRCFRSVRPRAGGWAAAGAADAAEAGGRRAGGGRRRAEGGGGGGATGRGVGKAPAPHGARPIPRVQSSRGGPRRAASASPTAAAPPHRPPAAGRASPRPPFPPPLPCLPPPSPPFPPLSFIPCPRRAR